MQRFKKEKRTKKVLFFIKMFTTKHYYSNMIKFIRTKQNIWDSIDKTLHSDSIVFIEDTQQVCVNNVNYFGKKLAGVEKVEFSTSSISIEPNKFYFCNEILNELDITLLGEGISNYFVEFICDNTCVILPSNIKWKNDIVPDFSKSAIMTIKIQDDTAYLIDCKNMYLGPCVTFTAQQDNSSIGLSKLSTNQTLEYSRDRSNWSNMDTTTNISLNNGDEVYVRGILSDNNTTANYTQFKMSGKIAASGNCDALWNYEDLNAPLKKYCGYYTFRDCKSLVAAPELPATILAHSCYQYMFLNCTSLVTAPEILPATELAVRCYYGMFQNCSSLTAAPELPAMELAEYCYNYMFSNCTSLTVAPVLPATELAVRCYYGMFYNCTNLNYIKCLATDISATNCTSNWVDGVSNTGTFVKHPNMNNWTTGVDGIPSGWIVEDAEIEYQLIDLGLPSGLKWADRNVGALNPEDAGLYFQWGDTVGYTADQVGVDKIFNWNYYKFGTSSNLTKYNSTDKLTVLESIDDAATVNMGSQYRMPTIGEIRELINNTTQTFIDLDGNEYSKEQAQNGAIESGKLKGVRFTGSNSNSIFIPATGYYNSSSLKNDESRLWSSNSNTSPRYTARYLNFYDDGMVSEGFNYRSYGQSVRGVEFIS